LFFKEVPPSLEPKWHLSQEKEGAMIPLSKSLCRQISNYYSLSLFIAILYLIVIDFSMGIGQVIQNS